MTLDEIKNRITESVNRNAPALHALSDAIFDDPERGFEESRACAALSDFLGSRGFEVETGYAGLATSFRAARGSGGPNVGLLCEYDALPMGHGCAHHLQGPSCIGAALAACEALNDFPFTVEVIGTPGEEIGGGGKGIMIKNGAFAHHDVALMMHGGDVTTVDTKSMELRGMTVTCRGVSSHAAISPELGRSALEALMLASNGIAYLRGHVRSDTRMNMIITDGGTVTNVIPDTASARVEMRSYSRPYLESVIRRVRKIFEGACMMTETSCEMEISEGMRGKLPIPSLNELLIANAHLAGAERISPPRENTGSTDFADVMQMIPGACVRVAFADRGVTAHSEGFLSKGKSAEAHNAISKAAMILAMTCADVVVLPENLKKIKDEFARERARVESDMAE